MFYDNLKAICDKQGVKITPIVLECGGNKGSLSGWKKGAMPNSDIVMKLAVRLNVPTDCLLFGESYNFLSLSEVEKQLIKCFGSLNEFDKCKIIERAETLAELAAEQVIRENKKEFNEKAKPKEINQLQQAPMEELDDEDEEEYIYIDFPDLPVSAGTGVYLHSDYTEPLKVAADDLTLRANYALRVAGDSMQPRYYDGDIVLVKTQPSVENGEVGIFIYNDEAYIKKFQGDRLVSLNPKYEDIPIKDPDSFYCKGKVIGILSIGNKRK